MNMNTRMSTIMNMNIITIMNIIMTMTIATARQSTSICMTKLMMSMNIHTYMMRNTDILMGKAMTTQTTDMNMPTEDIRIHTTIWQESHI